MLMIEEDCWSEFRGWALWIDHSWSFLRRGH
uniref:Uncharacterized protein n=1 Tax=Musa acuminata subsp. malaccensis TaxID=214687 RepID=A0A804KE26_MUSAM